jgi:hypothetical protein
MQTTGTQKLLFDVPQFSPGVPKLKSAQTYFADAWKLLNSKGAFPNVANALGLTNAEREAEIVGEGLIRMAERTIKLDTLLPSGYEYAFIDEPGVLRSASIRRRRSRNAGRRRSRTCASSSISGRSPNSCGSTATSTRRAARARRTTSLISSSAPNCNRWWTCYRCSPRCRATTSIAA